MNLGTGADDPPLRDVPASMGRKGFPSVMSQDMKPQTLNPKPISQKSTKGPGKIIVYKWDERYLGYVFGPTYEVGFRFLKYLQRAPKVYPHQD